MYKWQYDEMKQVGIDYTDIENIEEYDSDMQKIRNLEKEFEEIFDYINISSDKVIIEFGTGTGEFALEAAKQCSKVYAIDVSQTMLDFAKNKARERKINNIEFYNAGFLTYENTENIDAIVTQLALHHLPDFWKMIALKRMANMLKPEGKLFIRDVVYSFDTDNYVQFFDNFVEKIRLSIGEKSVKDAIDTVKEEYPTLSFIMEELINRSGFNIDGLYHEEGFMSVYKCRKCKNCITELKLDLYPELSQRSDIKMVC